MKILRFKKFGLIKNFKLDPRILLPLLIVVSFVYGISHHLSYNQKSPVYEEKAFAEEQCVYNNQSNYTIKEQEVMFDELNSFVAVKKEDPNLKFSASTYPPITKNRTAYSSERNEIATIVHYQHDKDVELRNLSTGEVKTIFTLNKEDWSEAQITGVSYSSDSQKLAIVTLDSLFIYDFGTKQVKTIFEGKPYPQDNGRFVQPNIPFGWSSNRKMILMDGELQKNDIYAVDIESGERSAFGYSLWGDNESPFGIYNNKLLLSRASKDNVNASDLYLVDVETREEEFIGSIAGRSNRGEIREDGVAYLIARELPEHVTNPCTIYGIELTRLIKVDLNTKEIETLLIADGTQTSKTYRNMHLVSVVLGRGEYNGQILLNMNWGTVPMQYLIDESDPTTLTQVNKDPADYPEPERIIRTPVKMVELDSDIMFNLINNLRIEEGVSALTKDDRICTVAKDLVSFMKTNKTIPTQTEYEFILKDRPFSYLNAMTGMNLPSENGAIEAFQQNLPEKTQQAFKGGEFVWGCVETEDNYTAFSYAY